jgi:hypothetical protein
MKQATGNRQQATGNWTPRCLLPVACCLLPVSLLITSEASAQEMGAGGPEAPTTGPSWGRPDVNNSPETGPRPKLSSRSVKLFDSQLSIVSYQLDVGPIWARRVQDETSITQRSNFEHRAPLAGEVGFGTVYTTPAMKGPFFLVGHLKTLLRVVDDKSFSWGVFHQELGGGLMLGPFEPEVRLRLSVLTVDVMHAEPSIQLLGAPGVSAGFGLHLGKIRLDIKAHSEYLWRWFGPDYLIRGVTIGIRLDQSRPNTPYPGAPPPTQ